MLLATRQKQQLRPLNLSLKADHIEQVQEHRHLDVIIDDDSTASHTLHMYARQSKKKKKKGFLLSQLKHFVDTSKRKLFYYAHISSHHTYASTVWDGCSDILFKKN